MLEETLANAAPELEESHAHGIKIVGYADTILFHPDMLQAEGVAYQSLYARDADGNAVINNGWDRGAGVSCPNNPGWLALQKQVAMVTAQAGFDGLMFDIYPYFISPGYDCHCQHCQDEWGAYSLRHLGQKAPFPKRLRGEDPTTERTSYKWRMQAYADFVSAIGLKFAQYNAVLKISGYPIPALETSSFAEDVVYWHLVADTVELLGRKSK